MRTPWIFVPLACLSACAPLKPAERGQTITHAIRVRHPGASSDAPKTYRLVQVNDACGFPSEYRLTVDSVICPDKVCRISTVDMAWDALGQYLRYALPPGEELEKGVAVSKRAAGARADAWDSAPFSEADYHKLDAILRDDFSLLGQEKLTGVFRSHGAAAAKEVDGVTGATPASIRDAVVEGASLTCYNLWHWAHGDVAAAAKELTHRQCSEALLLSFLASDRPHYALFALEHLRLHKLFGPSAVRAVEAALRGGDRGRIDLGLAYLRDALPDRGRYFACVAGLVLADAGDGRAYLLDRLAAEAGPLPAALFDAVSAGLPSWNNYYEIHLFLQLAARRDGATPAVIAQAARLLDNPNFFIARRAHAFLSDRPALDAATQARLEAFRDKAAREGRAL